MSEVFRFTAGDGPVLVSVPHAGTGMPDDLARRLTPAARRLPDTDWNVDRLVEFAPELGASLLTATRSRYLVDLNRPSDGRPLYPGRFETELCPTTSGDGERLYTGEGPDAGEVADRVERWWRPYHETLAATLEQIVARHGHAVLLDVHSVRSVMPLLFDGRLPDVNLGTHSGASCARTLTRSLVSVLEAQSRFDWIVDGRFKGGFITRNYGRPDRGVHAVQIEISWSAYADESEPDRFEPDRAAPMQDLLRRFIETASAFRD